jgi:hypothetical protein
MNGDLTRSRFDVADGYTAVRAQQGRVMLDADHNEQVDIQLADTRAGRVDLVGGSGAPADEPGFGIALAAGQPTLGAGRYLVDGIRVRNPAPVALDSGQPFLPASTPPTQTGTWLAYLEVWERPLTAVEEPSIREVALGGPDTTLRDQAVWQVRWLRLGEVAAAPTCAEAATALATLAGLYDGTLEPRLQPGAAGGPCIVTAAAGFRGLENQLYRVQIHAGNITADGADSGTVPTFTWSRDNAAVVASPVALSSTSPILLRVDRLGPGGTAGFEIGGTIEIRDDARVLSGLGGVLARIDDVQADALQLTLLGGATVPELQAVLGGARVIVRRWDSAGAVSIQAPAGSDGWIDLEDGIQVRFVTTRRYRTGDCWLIPARTAALPRSGQQLDWPLSAPGATSFAVRGSQGPVRHRVALAILDRTTTGWSGPTDCRRLFPPLTSITALSAAGGDGQHARSGDWLPAPIGAVVTRGSAPVAGARLRFRVASGGGQLSAAAPTAPSPAAQVDVTTDANGRAQVFWRLGAGPLARTADTTWEPGLAQTVQVVRLGPDGAPDGATVSFVAQALDHFNLHVIGGNGQQGRPGELLEVALRVRVDDGHRPVANAVVEFAILNLLFNGQPLDQTTGGSLLASVRFVSGELWPGGQRHHTVRTTTDADGVAQVQWTLGTRVELTTQRVEARLLDAAGTRTAQTGLFLAQLALAGEISWQPLVPWLAALLTGANRTVQAAIDAVAGRVDQVAASTVTFDPFLGLRWRATDNTLQPLNPATPIPLARLAAVAFRADLVPAGRNVTQVTPHGGVRLYAEIPDPVMGPGGARVVWLRGQLQQQTDRWEWTLSSQARAALGKSVPPAQPFMVRAVVVPRWLPGGVPTDSSAGHELIFQLVR